MDKAQNHFIRDFCAKYNAQIYDTGKTVNRYKSYYNVPIWDYKTDYFNELHNEIYQEKLLTIEIAESALNDLSHTLERNTKHDYDENIRKEYYSRLAQDHDEQKLREENLAVKAAWEYYQAAIALARKKK